MVRIISLIVMAIGLSSCSQKGAVLKIGLVADPQYADKSTAGSRYYRESLWKLEEAIDTFNYFRVDFVQTLGDVIDGEWENFDSILPVYGNLLPGIESYHLLGNHDFAVDTARLKKLSERLSMPDYYYSYVGKGWRFIVLDATDYSFFSNPLHRHPEDRVNSYYHNTGGNPNHQTWNSAIGEEQQGWLRQELERARKQEQKVIIFSHMPLRPLNNDENLWNDSEIIEIIENHPHVVAFINGHKHKGNYVFKNGIHYITIYGMVETMINSFGILEIYKDQLVLKGFGNQQSFILNYEQ